MLCCLPPLLAMGFSIFHGAIRPHFTTLIPPSQPGTSMCQVAGREVEQGVWTIVDFKYRLASSHQELSERNEVAGAAESMYANHLFNYPSR